LSENIYIGHALATYSLESHLSPSEIACSIIDTIVPRYKQIILEAIQSTRITYPLEKLVCMVDKRAFLAEQRNAIAKVLEDEGVSWTFKTADIKRMAEELYSSNTTGSNAISSCSVKSTVSVGSEEL
jgi:hypothetical protein